MATSGRQDPWGWSPGSTSPSTPISAPRRSWSSPGSVEAKPVNDLLFETPADLVCPITHEIFQNPVLNAAGQVYEQQAIAQHLQYHNTDPVTRMALPSKALTPVYLLRSRAMEYRESTARACVEAACTSGCKEPVKYLRRAAELCGPLSLPVQGLSREAMQYVLSHPSNAYDYLALQVFARGLFEAGYRDKAASLYYTLLQAGADKSQQADLLRQCLACWSGGAAGEVDGSTFEKLARFVEEQSAFSWTQILDICGEAGLGEKFCLRLAEQLLFRGGSKDGGAEGLDPVQWHRQKQILFKYVQVYCQRISDRQAAVEEALKTATGAHDGASKPASVSGPLHHLPDWLHPCLLASAVFTAATLANGNGLLLRLARLAPVLFMLPAGRC